MSQPSQTSVQSNAPPQQFLDAYDYTMGQAKNVAATPYQNYPGQIVADQSPDQIAAQNIVRGSQGIEDPYINSAADYIDTAAGPMVSDAANRGASGIMSAANQGQQQILGASGSFNPSAVPQWMSPYTQQVINATQAQFDNQNQQQQQQVIGNAISKGAWGGDRASVAQGIVAGQQQLAQAPVIAGLYNQGYSQAVQAALQQAGLGTQGATAAAGLGLQGATGAGQLGYQGAAATANNNLQAGYGMAGLGREALGSTLTGANALMSSGQQQQQQAQSQLNVPYQQWQAALQYPFQTTGWLANIAEGLGGKAGGTNTSTSPGPNALSQVAGLGLTGAGIVGSTGGFGSNGWLSGLLGGGGGGSGLPNVGDTWDGVARGGAIAHRAPGGGIPDVSMAIVPGGFGMGTAAADNAGSSLLGRDYGTTSHTEGGDNTLGTILSLVKIGATIAALKRGGGIMDAVPHHWGTHAPTRRDFGGGIPYVSLHPGASGHGVPHISRGDAGILAAALASGTGQMGGDSQSYIAKQVAGGFHGSPSFYTPPPPTTPTAPVDSTPKLIDTPWTGGNDSGDSGAGEGGMWRGGIMPRRAPGGLLGEGDDSYPIHNVPPELAGPGPAVADDAMQDAADELAPTLGGNPAPPQFDGADQDYTGGPGGIVAAAQAPQEPPSGTGIVAHPDSALATPQDRLYRNLLYSGLGILGQTSPNALVNLGRGAMQGQQMARQATNDEETRQLRIEQAKTNAEWRKSQAALLARREDTRSRHTDIEAQRATAYAARVTAMAALRGASHATEGDVLNRAVEEMTRQTNPATGQPYTRMEALRLSRGVDVREARANTAATAAVDRHQEVMRKLDQGDEALATKMLSVDLQSRGMEEKAADRQAKLDLERLKEERRARQGDRRLDQGEQGLGIKQQVAGTNQDRADTGRIATEAKAEKDKEEVAIKKRAVELRGTGLDQRAADAQARLEFQREKEARVATQAAQRIDQTAQRIDQTGQRIDQTGQRLDQQSEAQKARAAQIATSSEATTARLRLQQTGIEQSNARAIVADAARMVAMDLTGKLTLPVAIAQATKAFTASGGTLAAPNEGKVEQPLPRPVAPTSPTGPARPRNKQEYDALPAGTEYVDPDGKTRRKGG